MDIRSSLLLLFMLMPVSSAVAQSQNLMSPTEVEAKQDSKEDSSKRVQSKAGKSSPVQNRDELYTFVREHHPDLEKLLDRLESRFPGQYQAAMKSLSRSRDRLARMENRDPERYGIALKEWKIKSRIQLVSVRLGMNDTPELNQKLEELAEQAIRCRETAMQMESARLQKRLDQLNQNLQRLESNREQESSRVLENAKKTTRRVRTAYEKRNRKNAKRKSTDK